ncbi:Ulp1 peptidase [Bertholletia excelsa]
MSPGANNVTIKVKYKDITLKFQLSPSSGVVELRQQVAKRLNLEDETYSMMYKDEDDDHILIAIDEDLQYYIRECQLQGSTTVVIHLVPRSEAGRRDRYTDGEHEADNTSGGLNSENEGLLANMARGLLFSGKGRPNADSNRWNALSDKGKMIRKYFSYPHTEDEKSRIMSGRSWPSNFAERVGLDRSLNLKASDLRALALPVLHNYSEVDNPKDYYVSDTCVDVYMELLKRRQTENSGCYIPCGFISPFYSSLVYSHDINGEIYNRSQKFVKRDELLGKKKVFIPICVNQHWFLLVADFIQKKLLWFDSSDAPADSNHQLKSLFAWSVKRDVLSSMTEYNDSEWEFVSRVQNCPIQANSVDCGVYVMMIMDCLTCGEELPFNDADMENIRPKLFLDLFAGKIRHPCLEGLES